MSKNKKPFQPGGIISGQQSIPNGVIFGRSEIEIPESLAQKMMELYAQMYIENENKLFNHYIETGEVLPSVIYINKKGICVTEFSLEVSNSLPKFDFKVPGDKNEDK